MNISEDLDEFNQIYNNLKERQNIDIQESLEYKGTLAICENFKSQYSCKSYVSEIPNIPQLDFIITECENWVLSFDNNNLNLSDDELLAISLYTYDLKLNGKREDNFYYIFSNILRKRNISDLENWKGFIYYFQSALSKLPNFTGSVYRGVPFSPNVIQNYTLNRRIHWSAFSSASNDINIAKGFATEGGIILEIKILNGRVLGDYSFYPTESEIVLSPNTTFIVSDIHDNAGYTQICLVEPSDVPTFIF